TGAVADSLADTADMQHPRVANVIQRQLRRPHAAGRRALAHITEGMLITLIADEVNAGRRVGINMHGAGIDVLATPQVGNGTAEGIISERSHMADTGALPGRSNGTVRGVATVVLQIGCLAIVLCLAELEHRLAETNYIHHENPLRKTPGARAPPHPNPLSNMSPAGR